MTPAGEAVHDRVRLVAGHRANGTAGLDGELVGGDRRAAVGRRDPVEDRAERRTTRPAARAAPRAPPASARSAARAAGSSSENSSIEEEPACRHREVRHVLEAGQRRRAAVAAVAERRRPRPPRCSPCRRGPTTRTAPALCTYSRPSLQATPARVGQRRGGRGRAVRVDRRAAVAGDRADHARSGSSRRTRWLPNSAM